MNTDISCPVCGFPLIEKLGQHFCRVDTTELRILQEIANRAMVYTYPTPLYPVYRAAGSAHAPGTTHPKG